MDPKGKTVVRNLGVILKQREQYTGNVKIAVGLMLTNPGLAREHIPKQGPNIRAEFGNLTS